MGERGAKGERIWPKLTRPEIKNEQKEKALRFRRGEREGIGFGIGIGWRHMERARREEQWEEGERGELKMGSDTDH